MTTFPSVFVSHGAPTFALEPGLAGAQLKALGAALGTPRAIVIVSPHWTTSGVRVAAAKKLDTIHDFGGFPEPLYRLEYPAPGAPAIAGRVAELLRAAGIDSALDFERGLDHGAWVPLLHMYPLADVPVVQLSMPRDLDAPRALALGRALAPLSQEGMLVIGSGSLTHNLYEFRMGDAAEAQYAREFSAWIREAILAGDEDGLLHALDQAPHARRAHPTAEHFLPLLIALGAASAVTPATVLDGGIRHGVLAMESFAFGESVNLTVGSAS